jgi:hypothetical protein
MRIEWRGEWSGEGNGLKKKEGGKEERGWLK